MKTNHYEQLQTLMAYLQDILQRYLPSERALTATQKLVAKWERERSESERTREGYDVSDEPFEASNVRAHRTLGLYRRASEKLDMDRDTLARDWASVPAEDYMEQQDYTPLERRILRVLLVQEVMRKLREKPFDDRLSGLLSLISERSSTAVHLAVVDLLMPYGRLRQEGLVCVEGALLCSDPVVKLQRKALLPLLGENLFLLLGLEPIATPPPSPALPGSLEKHDLKNVLVEGPRQEAARLAALLGSCTGGTAWAVPPGLDVADLPAKLLGAALQQHGGLLVLDTARAYTSGTLVKLLRHMPVLKISKKRDAIRVQAPEDPDFGAALHEWLSSQLASDDA
ncbi:MAG: hypothetical protein KatS3mg043_2187 [Rhodothermaceae bacterium]|nr:MAG: hypothetical protein KatS3mg043_2187 [Rhodothermaceae bacterium]